MESPSPAMLLPTTEQTQTRRSSLTQRLFDLVIAVPTTLLLAPLLAVIAFAIKRDSRGPALFLQRRIGRHGREFDIYKFRTMVVDAEQRGAQITIGRDPRITNIGHFLRRTRLDELPQLFNIIRGEMSLVGPRPEVPRYVALYTEEQKQILALRPGLTSPASIAFRNESELLAAASNPEAFYCDEVMPAKLRIDLDYARGASLRSDCQVLVETFWRLAA